MDVGRALITSIIDYNDMDTPTASGVRLDWFDDKDQKATYQWMLDYYDRYGEVPTEIALKTEFPNFKMLSISEPLEFYIDLFRVQHERSILMDALIGANEALEEGDNKRAHEQLAKGVDRIGADVNVLVDENVITQDSRKKRFGNYEHRRETAGVITGIATGFPSLDRATSGYHNGQFILIGGAPKQCKSYVLMINAIAAHDQGQRVLFASFEMSAMEHLIRYDSITAGVNSAKLRHGRLDGAEMKRLKRCMAIRRNLEPFVITSDRSAMTTVSALAAKIKEHKPDIVFVDGVYLMENEVGAEPLSTQAYTAVSRSVKRLAQRIDLPLVCTTQALTSKLGKGGVVNLGSLGWTSAWAQDADLIMGSMNMPAESAFQLSIVGGRDVGSCEMMIACNWEESLFQEVSDEEDGE